LAIRVDTRWTTNYGYRPVEIVVSSLKPTPADHLITLQLYSGWGANNCVEQDIDMPKGSTSATTIIRLPIFDRGSTYVWWDVTVDGIKDLDLSLDRFESLRIAGASGASVSNLSFLVPCRTQVERSLVSTSSFEYEALSLKIAAFPQRWIDYSSIDVVALSAEELNALGQLNPSALEAICRWVRAGGNLWVSNVGDKLQELPQVSKLLGMPDKLVGADVKPSDASDKAATIAVLPARATEGAWAPARYRRGFPGGQVKTYLDIRTGQSRVVRDPNVIATLDRDSNFVPTNQQFESGGENTDRWPQDSGQVFVEQRRGLGLVRAFRAGNDAGLDPQATLTATAGATTTSDSGEAMPRSIAWGLRGTRSWETRHGIVPDGGNPEFAKMLVPGVGLAPVTEFQVLISLFVIVIGPLNYWLLKRFKRLQLLVLTVPLAAAAMTAALFAYAIVSDGFATTVRARSYTTLDQRTGEAASWAQLSYYAGLAPGQGLSMPADVVVYPIQPNWSTEASRSINRVMRWEDDEMKLTRGWLNSRTPTQYLTVRARKTANRLDVAAGRGKARVTNRFGTPIEALLLFDDEGNIFSGENLAAEAAAVLQSISREDAIKWIVDIVRENQPEAPAALAGSDRDFSSLRGRSGRRMYRGYDPSAASGQLAENIANTAIADLAGLNGRPALDMPPRSYVAVTTTGPEVATGIPYAAEEASFHVIVGRW